MLGTTTNNSHLDLATDRAEPLIRRRRDADAERQREARAAALLRGAGSSLPTRLAACRRGGCRVPITGASRAARFRVRFVRPMCSMGHRAWSRLRPSTTPTLRKRQPRRTAPTRLGRHQPLPAPRSLPLAGFHAPSQRPARKNARVVGDWWRLHVPASLSFPSPSPDTRT